MGTCWVAVFVNNGVGMEGLGGGGGDAPNKVSYRKASLEPPWKAAFGGRDDGGLKEAAAALVDGKTGLEGEGGREQGHGSMRSIMYMFVTSHTCMHGTRRREGDDFQLRFSIKMESTEETFFAFGIPHSYRDTQVHARLHAWVRRQGVRIRAGRRVAVVSNAPQPTVKAHFPFSPGHTLAAGQHVLPCAPLPHPTHPPSLP